MANACRTYAEIGENGVHDG